MKLYLLKYSNSLCFLEVYSPIISLAVYLENYVSVKELIHVCRHQVTGSSVNHVEQLWLRINQHKSKYVSMVTGFSVLR